MEWGRVSFGADSVVSMDPQHRALDFFGRYSLVWDVATSGLPQCLCVARQVKHFLGLEPKAPMEWPAPVLKLAHRGFVSQAVGGDFWNAVTFDRLKDMGSGSGDADLMKIQAAMVAERIMTMTQEADMERVKSGLKALCEELRKLLPLDGLAPATLNQAPQQKHKQKPTTREFPFRPVLRRPL